MSSLEFDNRYSINFTLSYLAATCNKLLFYGSFKDMSALAYKSYLTTSKFPSPLETASISGVNPVSSLLNYPLDPLSNFSKAAKFICTKFNLLVRYFNTAVDPW